jgi:hypothetical protein
MGFATVRSSSDNAMAWFVEPANQVEPDAVGTAK